MVTMKEVALAAGVSQAAVSYAFNNSSKISSRRAEEIRRIARSMGYHGPNNLGVSLRSGKFGAIGLMLADTLSMAVSDPSTTALIEGITRSELFNDWPLTLIPLSGRKQSGDGNPLGTEPGLRGAVDGLIVHSLPDDHPAVLTMIDRGLPMVVIDSPNLPGVPLIGIHQFEAAKTQAEAVLDAGHTRVVILADRLRPDGSFGWVDRTRRAMAKEFGTSERIRGYRQAFKDRGFPDSAIEVYEAGGFDDESAAAAVNNVFEERPATTAIIATSDKLAFAVFGYCQRTGKRIPDDVSVVGFDDAKDSERLGLSTVRQPLVEKGSRAAKALISLMDKRMVAEETNLPFSFISRGSISSPTNR